MLFTFLCLLVPLVYSEGVSVKVDSRDDEFCVFAEAKHRGEKLAFYYSVQSAGSSDEFGVLVWVHNTKKEAVLENDGEATGDYVFSANAAGEYSFCFVNHHGATKMIYVDVTAESDTYLYGGNIGSELAKPPSTDQSAKNDIKEKKSKLDDMILTLNAKMDTLHKQMMYIKAREGRSISTVKSTQSRIRWFTFLESSLMIGISVAQVFLIRTFFSRPGALSRI